MPHSLEQEFGLTAEELLECINCRFRAKVTLEGAVAEVHLGKYIKRLKDRKVIERYEEHDLDKYPDYTIWIPGGRKKGYQVECKNVRDKDEAYRDKGQIVAYKVETQKTRTSQGDTASRYYDADYFDILAVCLGKKTHNWRQFMYIQTKDLARHSKYPTKLAVMHPVPLPDSIELPWYDSLETLLSRLQE